MRFAALALATCGGFFLTSPATAQIYNYWGIGSIRSGFTTGSTTSTSNEQSWYTNQSYGGMTYSATGENITPSGSLGPGTSYNVATPGAPFQFSESYFSGGLTSTGAGGKTVITNTLTNSLSVFAEIQ